MIEKLVRYFRGYVEICVSGEQLERFLNLCKGRGITMSKIFCPDSGRLTAVLSLRNFFRLRPIRSKTKVHICVAKKHGLPFFFYRNKKRKAFFLGILLCLILMGGLSTRIWNIHIEGNRANSTPEILKFLEKSGIIHGMAKSEVNCGEIAAMIRRQYGDVAWVSARIRGTRLILTVQEGLLTEAMEDENEPCNLLADKDGTVVKIITRQGVPVVHPGELCKKGDLLVSGELSVLNDNKEVVRYAYVRADADVYVEYKLRYFRKFPLKYESQIPSGKKKVGFSLRVGNIYLETYPWQTGGKYLNFFSQEQGIWRRTEETFPIRITENFCLPVILGKAVFTKYIPCQGTLSKAEAKALATKRFQLYEEELLKKGIRISENNVSIRVTESVCITEGALTVIEKIGKKTPVMQKKQPTGSSEPGN